MASVGARKDNRHFATENRDRFLDLKGVEKTKSLRPPERPFDPNKPPMDMKTTNGEDFHDMPYARQDLIRLKGDLDDVIHDKTFYGDTTSRVSYPGHQVTRKQKMKPVKQMQNMAPLESETEYRKYINSDKTNAKKASRVPDRDAKSYKLLYPNPVGLPQKSVKNQDHDGRYAPPRELIPGATVSLTFGREGERYFTTTNDELLKKPEQAERTAPIRNDPPMVHAPIRSQIVPKSHQDFAFDQKTATAAKAKPFSEKPPEVSISWNMPNTYTSTQQGTFPHHGDVSKRSLIRLAEQIEPSGKFEGKSTAHGDFVNPGPVHRAPLMKPPDAPKPDKIAPLETSYTSNFKGTSVGPRHRYGASHKDNLRVASNTRHFNPKSVNMDDFVKHDLGITVPAPAPEPTLKVDGSGEFFMDTSYKSSYQKPEFDSYGYTKIEQEAHARNESRNALRNTAAQEQAVQG